MPGQWQEKRLLKAQVGGKWRYVTEFRELANGAIVVQFDGTAIQVPPGAWKEVTVEQTSEKQHGDLLSSGSEIDLQYQQRKVARPASRLKKDRIPPEKVALTFIGVAAAILGILIIAALMTRF